MTRYLKNQHTRDLMLKNPYTCNKRFNFLLNGMNSSIGTDEWDYFAREIEKTMKIIKANNKIKLQQYEEYNNSQEEHIQNKWI